MKKDKLSLDKIQAEIARNLTDAVTSREHPFRLMVIGTIGMQAANLRTVVLRAFQADRFLLTFYTDIRSQKINELQNNPNLTCLFWDQERQIQIKIVGKTEIEHNTQHTQSIWKNMHIGAKKAYLTLSAPSSIQNTVSNNLPENLLTIDEKLLDDQYFCMVHCEIKRMEWLQLGRSAHIRAEFQKNEFGQWKGHWLVP